MASPKWSIPTKSGTVLALDSDNEKSSHGRDKESLKMRDEMHPVEKLVADLNNVNRMALEMPNETYPSHKILTPSTEGLNYMLNEAAREDNLAQDGGDVLRSCDSIAKLEARIAALEAELAAYKAEFPHNLGVFEEYPNHVDEWNRNTIMGVAQ